MNENRKLSRNSTVDYLTDSQLNWLRLKLDKAEKSDFITDTKEEILAQAKILLKGKLSIIFKK